MSRINIIFLDIDGVLNSSSYIMATNDVYGFNPECVKYLNEILNQTGARIIISSSWRIGRTVKELQDIFNEQGVIPGRVLGRTNVGDSRGEEINEIVEDCRKDINRFVIVDDDVHDIVDWFPLHTVKINGERGLTFENMNDIIKRLNHV